MADDTVSRDVGEQSKGFFLQKLRGVSLLLDATAKEENAQIYCALEDGADVHLVTADSDRTVDYSEEDKNYAENTGFTFLSTQVLKTLVGFVDAWFKFRFSKNLVFGFYTPNPISKERRTDRVKRLNLNLPELPILEMLERDSAPSKEALEVIKAMLIDEYKEQYKKHDGDGYLDSLLDQPDEDWCSFLSKIQWKFGEEDEKKLEEALLEKIKASSFYKRDIRGKEQFVISHLTYLLDKKQKVQDPTEKYVHAAHVKNVFLEVAADEVRQDDPAWKEWGNLGPSDARNLEDKIKSVCANVDQKRIRQWSRQVSLNMHEQQNLEHDRSVNSLKYRVLLECQEKLNELQKNMEHRAYSPEQIEKMIESLVNASIKGIADASKSYRYTISHDNFVKGLTLWLIESCFISFDEVRDG